ncbi:hydroxylysine kinase-like isoform X2 [Mercenaria mercenaria]|uniref:hydroxylysine kinase-like isoform X2 n=1 Tax=Mercenaria mercenaria TaxID=6596 RepID=UPI00234F093E|nr:hydroxylysine kinase-like isoform X2 [Mercenaria mercenaria]
MGESIINGDTRAMMLQDPEEDVRPRVSKHHIPELVYRLYGLQVDEIKDLPCYDDLNFYVHAKDTCENKHITSVNKHGYVLKVLKSLLSTKPDIVDAQHALCQYIREQGVATQIPIPNREGLEWSLETFAENKHDKTVRNGPYLVRLLTFIPGKLFRETPYVPGSFYNVGKFLGRLHKAMTGFHHSFYDVFTTIWSLEEAPVVRKFLTAVPCKEDVTIVEEVITAFENHVFPNFNKFTRGIIHGDVNEQNTIMCEVPGQDNIPSDEHVHDVCALLDFADVTDSYLVFDVAICIAYLSIECPDERQADVGGHILAGYYKSYSLNEDEFEALKVLICARLCQSLVYSAHSYAQQPGNEYILVTAKRGWPLLYKLWQIPSVKLYSNWKAMIKLYEKE